ncbi:MAG: alanine racemase [Bdellovibrionales bacterium]|nr:alanine racemase [Bdellovibrionales bacterium]
MKTTTEVCLVELFRRGTAGFLYVEDQLIDSVTTLRKFWRDVSQPGFKLLFSVKANPNSSVLLALQPHVDGFDVSSRHEAALLRRLGISPTSITWSGPAKTDRALAEIYQHGADCIHLDSFDEWQACQRFEGQRTIRKSIRVGISDSPSKKLGFSADEFSRLLKSPDFKLSGEKFSGIHAYLGRDAFSTTKLAAFLEEVKTFRKADVWADDFELYLGPGLPAVLTTDASLRSGLIEPLREICSSHRMSIECGRAVSQPSGYYFTRVLAVKKTDNHVRVIIDGGLQHMAGHLRSPSYGQTGIETYFFRSAQRLEVSEQCADIQGSLSIWYDKLLENVKVPASLERGDWIVIGHCGAYGYTAACNQFIGPTPIGEWMLSSRGEMSNVFPEQLMSYHAVLDGR